MADQSSRGLRILLTNNTLAAKAGSEMYVRDLAIELMKRGHRPVAYSSVHGVVAEELRTATVPVIDDLAALGEAPDLIHGQHHLDAMAAMLRFPRTPAVFVCHGWAPWEEMPPLFPSIGRYVAVDDLCRERLLSTPGIDAADIDTIYNFVDLQRFQPRAPLPDRPTKALVFSNYASDSPQLLAIRRACERFGIEQVDVAGLGSGNPIQHPEAELPRYDLVFAKARCALEAMAVGCAVVVTDYAGLAGMVTTDNMQGLRQLNFGVRTMQQARVTEDSIFAELSRYDADDARQVSRWIRQQADLQAAVDRWEEVYRRLLDSAASSALPASPETMLNAAADYLCSLHEPLKKRRQADAGAARAGTELKRGLQLQDDLQRQIGVIRRERDAARNACDDLQRQMVDLRQERNVTCKQSEDLQRQAVDLQRERAEAVAAVATAEAGWQQRFVALQAEAEVLARQTAACRQELEVIHRSPGWKAIGRYRKLLGHYRKVLAWMPWR